MEYRPCIDIHNGKVKQIVGATLSDESGQADENFVSERGADFFAGFYRDEGLVGGHVIMLNKPDSPYYEATKEQAKKALLAFPGGLQIGGGINPDNAGEFLAAGASHVIITSYAFSDGELSFERLDKMVKAAGKEHIVLDLSVRKRRHNFYVVTDRWQTFTSLRLEPKLLKELEPYCDEYLVHAADVEGKTSGIDEEVLSILAEYAKGEDKTNSITYAGGISTYEDIETIKELGDGNINITIGSAMDLFGGDLNYETVMTMCNHL